MSIKRDYIMMLYSKRDMSMCTSAAAINQIYRFKCNMNIYLVIINITYT